MADKQQIQERLTDVMHNPDMAEAIATALCGDLGYRNIPESQLDSIALSARKAASEAESVATIAAFDASMKAMLADESNSDALLSLHIPAFRSFFSFVDMLLLCSTYTHGAIIYGNAGVGKTRGVMNRLVKFGVPYALYNSYSTPLAFYEMLYRNNGKTVVLDDVNTLLRNPLAVALLKAALFSVGTERLITYSSTAKVLEDRGLPAQFIFTGRVILILNEIPSSLKETFQALLSRVYEYKLELTKQEKLKLVEIVFKTSDVFGIEEKPLWELYLFLESVLDFSNLHKFNVRTALRAAEIWKLQGAEKAKPMIMDLMETDLKLKAFVMIEDGGAALPVSAKVHVWEECTGYSRRSYFDVKARHNRTHYGQQRVEDMLRADIKDSLDSWVRS